MDQRSVAVEYTDSVTLRSYHLELAPANGYIAAKRAMLQAKAIDDNKKETDEVKKFAHLYMYPDMLAPVLSCTGFEVWPIPLDDLLNLDEEFIVAWSNKVYELNPHWRAPEEVTDSLMEKKEMTPNGKSGASSHRTRTSRKSAKSLTSLAVKTT